MDSRTFFRKLTTVVFRPQVAARGASYHLAQIQGRRRLVGCGLQSMVRALEEKCRATGALPPNYMELWLLYSDVRARKPAVIFEFGSGLSTNVMASALRDNYTAGHGRGMIYSFEADRKWYEVTEQWLDISLAEFVELVYAPVRIESYFGAQVLCHDNIPPEVRPDMVYLDGPSFKPGIKVAADLIDLEDRIEPNFFLVIDGRKTNAAFLDEHFKRRYRKFVRTGLFGGAYLQRCYELQG